MLRGKNQYKAYFDGWLQDPSQPTSELEIKKCVRLKGVTCYK